MYGEISPSMRSPFLVKYTNDTETIFSIGYAVYIMPVSSLIRTVSLSARRDLYPPRNGSEIAPSAESSVLIRFDATDSSAAV